MANAQKMAFYESLKQAAIEQQIKYGVPASVTLAQAWIEHGNYSKTTNNYFGIHDDDGYWRRNGGKTVELNDHGRMAHFRVYDNMEHGIEDHSRFFFRKNSRYSDAHSISPLDPKYGEKWAMVICRAGYAERPKDDPDRYGNTLIREIRDYGLDKIDQEAVALAQQRGQQIGYMRGSNAPLPSQSAKSAVAASTAGNYCFPVAGNNLIMSDGFGKSPTSYRHHDHNGIDLRARFENVFATEDNGIVVATGYQKSGGNFVTVEYDRADGAKYRISYCHLDDIAVKKGDTETLEIMFPHQMPSRLLHQLHIQRIIVKICVQPSRWHTEFPVQDAVLIGFAAFGEAGMKILLHLTGILHHDIIRQPLVQSIANLLRRHAGIGVKNANIPQRMNPRIGAAGTGHANVLPVEC